jgi:integrase
MAPGREQHLPLPAISRVAIAPSGAWAALRFGELAALRRRDIDLDRAVLHVEQAVVVVKGQQIVGDRKSVAGIREVAFHTGLVKPTAELDWKRLGHDDHPSGEDILKDKKSTVSGSPLDHLALLRCH